MSIIAPSFVRESAGAKKAFRTPCKKCALLQVSLKLKPVALVTHFLQHMLTAF